MFRLEFLEQYSKPLCSDAFSGFIMNDPNFEKCNSDVEEASNYLEEKIIPLFAKEFSGLVLSGNYEEIRITEEMHSKGINMRYLGLVFQHVMRMGISPLAGYLLLLEGISRVLKRTLRTWFRKSVQELCIPLEIPYHSLVVDILNAVFGSSEMSILFWEEVILAKLTSSFSFALTQTHLARASRSLDTNPGEILMRRS